MLASWFSFGTSVAATLAAAVGASPAHPTSGKGPSADAAAIVGEVHITRSALTELVGNRTFRLESEQYALFRRVLDERVDELLLERAARARSLTVADLLKSEVEAKVAPLADDEAQKVYESNPDRFRGLSVEAAREEIRSGIMEYRRGRRRAAFLKELRAAAGVRVMLDPPRLRIPARAAPARGPMPAVVQLVVYSDYECPYCQRMNTTILQIADRFKDSVRIEYRDFPLPNHKNAPAAAVGAICADKQGRFWELHQKLFENQRELSSDRIVALAGEAGVSRDAFSRCFTDGIATEPWKPSRQEGEALGVSGTPTIFVNGRLVPGVVPYEFLADLVQEEIDWSKEGRSRASR